METVTIERATNELDFREFHRLQAIYEAWLEPELRHDLPDSETLRHLYTEPNAAFLARERDATVGCVALTYELTADVTLKRLFVNPEQRKAGIGRRLVATVIAYARERGSRRVLLDTARDQLRSAYHLYRSMGFVEREPPEPLRYGCQTHMQFDMT